MALPPFLRTPVRPLHLQPTPQEEPVTVTMPNTGKRRLDPELTDGLTCWGDGWGAQMRDHAVTEDDNSLVGFRVVGSEPTLVLSLHGVPQSSEVGEPYVLNVDAARQLRDLLNIATARGAL